MVTQAIIILVRTHIDNGKRNISFKTNALDYKNNATKTKKNKKNKCSKKSESDSSSFKNQLCTLKNPFAAP